MNKRELILDALQDLLREGRAGTASVSDIARKAGIAKGGMYYYFASKEEVFDALAQRQYDQVIAACHEKLGVFDGDALTKLKLLLFMYRSQAVDTSIDVYLHQPENAAIHQKSMASILQGLTPIVAEVLTQGVVEGLFVCENPAEAAQLLLSVLVFLLDPGLFEWSDAQTVLKLETLSEFLEKGLQAPSGSFSFLYEHWSKQTLA